VTPANKEVIGKLTRGAWVFSIYRWLMEVAFLFAAFSEFPDHKASIGFAVLAFGAAVSCLLQMAQISHSSANILADEGERKTRHSIVLAAEMAAKGVTDIDLWSFWLEVDRRVQAEHAERSDLVSETGFWKGFGLASAALLWQLAASLFGLGVVAALTSN
jgi:hypothetical protein